MLVARSGHQATLLLDGRVLASGGSDERGQAVAAAEIFDPVTNTWSAAAASLIPRLGHTATLLRDGRVLVVGGVPFKSSREPVHAAELYDPSTDRWSIIEDLPVEAGQDTLTTGATDDGSTMTVLPAGMLMVAGGVSSSGRAVDWVRLSDPSTGAELATTTWSMNVARADHTATRLRNGAVLLAGGRNGATPLASSEIYIPRLPYETSPIGIPRFGRDGRGPFSYGSWAAAATNSSGNLLVSYRGGIGVASQLLEWDRARLTPPTFTQAQRQTDVPLRDQVYRRSLGANLPVLNSIRIDERDNIWAVSSDAQEVFKIGADGQVLLRFGNVEQPADIAWDKEGHVFVADGGDRPRILKFDARGRLLAATGGKGSRPGELDGPHSMAADASGSVYVADSGNARIQVFDNNLSLRAVYGNIGTPWAICITSGSRQFLYSVSNPEKSERASHAPGPAEIYKLELDGTILGKAVGDEATGSISSLDYIHCRRAKTIFGLGYRNLHAITFAR